MKFRGIIGYDIPVEDPDEPGVFMPQFVERKATGDVLDLSTKWKTDKDSTNDDIVLSKKISILMDPFVEANFSHIRYVIYMGTKWRVESATPRYPRIELTLGGVYNGKPKGST